MGFIEDEKEVVERRARLEMPAAIERTKRSNAVAHKPRPPVTNRGKATREKLKAALLSKLDEMPLHDIRLEDIARGAGVRVSLVYHYFRGKDDVVQEILKDIIDRFKQEVANRTRPENSFEAILFANERIVALYADNPGAMRCLVDSHDGNTPLTKMWRALTLDWNMKIARSICHQFPEAFPDNGGYIAISYALAGMVDNFLYEYFVLANPVLRNCFKDQGELARFLTILWYRTLHLDNVPDDMLGRWTGFELLQSQKFKSRNRIERG